MKKCSACEPGIVDDRLGFTRVDAAAFAQCPANSIDYAVMEKTDRAAVVPLVTAEDLQRGWLMLDESRASYAFAATTYAFPIQYRPWRA